jgi:hypothetical protein
MFVGYDELGDLFVPLKTGPFNINKSIRGSANKF